MSGRTEEYSSRQAEEDHQDEHPDERPDWKSTDRVTSRFLTDLRERNPELVLEIRNAGQGNLDHRNASWNREEPTGVHHGSGDKRDHQHDHEYRLDPETSAGQIFHAFQHAVEDTPTENRHDAAREIVETMLNPSAGASWDLENHRDHSGLKPAPSLADTLEPRLWNLQYIMHHALVLGKSGEFAEEVDHMRHLNQDMDLLNENPDRHSGFPRMLENRFPLLSAEMDALRGPAGDRLNPSWLRYEEGHGNADNIFQTFQELRLGLSLEYTSAAAEKLAETLTHPIADGIGRISAGQRPDLVNAGADHPMTRAVTGYLEAREKDLRDTAELGLTANNAEIYGDALNNMATLMSETEQALAGYIPNRDWNDQTGNHSQAAEPLIPARKLGRERAGKLDQAFTEFNRQNGEEPPAGTSCGELAYGQNRQSNLYEFTSGMLPADRDRMASRMAEQTPDRDRGELGRRLRQTMGPTSI